MRADAWPVLKAWRDDIDVILNCRMCGIAIRPGDRYRVVGIYVLCTFRPFCPSPRERKIAPEPRRVGQRQRRRRVIIAGRPKNWRISSLPLVMCRCGQQFRQQVHKGQLQKTCSRLCTYRMLEERAASKRQATCAWCQKTYTLRSEAMHVRTCSLSCGAKLREHRKREARQAS